MSSQPVTEGNVRILCTIFAVSSSLKLFQNKFFFQGWHSPSPKQHGHCGLLGKIPAGIHHSRFWGTIPGWMPSWYDPGPALLCCLPSASIPPSPQRAAGRCMKQTLRLSFYILCPWKFLLGPSFFRVSLSLSFFKICLFLNWSIIALQNFVVFCQTSTWISHRHKYIPFLLNFPPIF